MNWISPVTPMPRRGMGMQDINQSLKVIRDLRCHNQQVTLDPDLVNQYECNMQHRHYSYWRERGFPSYLTMEFRVGWTGERYAFPWFYRGILTAIKLRRDDNLHPDKEPKYISLTGSRYLAPYNIDTVLATRPGIVLVVEDEKSVIAAAAEGFIAIGAPAGSFKEEWARLLSHVPEIVIVADWDEAGIAAAERRQKILRRGRITVATGFFLDGRKAKDLHDLRMAGLPIRQGIAA